MAVAAQANDPFYILYSLVAKDFKIRYRNMSLGIFWSLVNPLTMMAVLTFVFTVVYKNQRPYFPLFVLMGLLPYSFFTLAWSSGTNSIVDNAPLIKKVLFQRELVPVSVVLGNAVHYLIQIAMLLLAVGLVIGPNVHWLWLPLVLLLQIVFVCGTALFCSALDVYYRDVRYVVESANLVLFWLVPIFYGLEDVPPGYAWLYQWNPIAAVILITRRILLEGASPELGTLVKLTLVSVVTLAAGFFTFRRIQKDFSDYL